MSSSWRSRSDPRGRLTLFRFDPAFTRECNLLHLVYTHHATVTTTFDKQLEWPTREAPKSSRDAVLRIGNPPVKPALPRPPVERHGEISERVGRVRGPIVHRMGPQRLQLVVVVGAIELERVEAARAFGLV